MQPFRGDSDTFTASIAIDASTIGNVTTTVAVYATREEEIHVLDSLRDIGDRTDVRFVPFKSKSNHFDKEDDAAFYERVLRENEPRIHGLHFEHHSASRNQHYVEADSPQFSSRKSSPWRIRSPV